MTLRRLSALSTWVLPTVMALTVLTIFWRLGLYGVRMWDETRHGETAWQMLQRGDFLNYYYDGKQDDWLAKPPLGVWLIALAYKLVGFNEWALRLPSALASCVSVLLTFQLVRLYKGRFSAGLVCLILLTCRGIIGPHVARTGDLDGVYVCTAMGMIYFLVRYLRQGDRAAMLASGLCGALCFFTKGFMLGLFVPGLALYVLTCGRLRTVLKDGFFWAGALLAGAAVPLWYWTVKTYATPYVDSHFGRDSWEVMLNYDVWKRFTEKIEGDNSTADFIIAALDTRFGPWIYLLVLTLPLMLWGVKRNGLGKRLWQRLRSDDLLKLSLCMVLPTCFLLIQAETKFNWYLSITTPFLSILTLMFVRFAAQSKSTRGKTWVWGLFGAVGIAAIAMQLNYLTRNDHTMTDQLLQEMDLVQSARHIYATRKPAYNTVLTLKWRVRAVELADAEVLARPRDELTPKISRVPDGEGFDLLLLPGQDD